MRLLFILLLGLGFTQTTMKTIELRISKNELLDLPGDIIGLNLKDYIDGDIDYCWVKVNLIKSDFYGEANRFFIYSCSSAGNVMYEYNAPYFPGPNEGVGQGITDELFFSESDCNLYGLDCSFWLAFYPQGGGTDFLINLPDEIILNITAPFPENDTGYIEEGYQFCVQPGANLLSFPCDNPISVNQSLPQGAENFITQIVGQGVATSYNPTLGWIGSLDNFSPGSGYWFKSNESLCFEYDCVED